MPNEIITVNGLTIRERSTYKVRDKVDRNALDGLINYGSTKIPDERVGTIAGCRFVDGLYDTGFYTNSPCYRGVDPTTVKSRVATLVKSIVTPFEAIHGKGVLDNTNLEFWDKKQYTLYTGKYFSTANPDELLDLYLAMLGYELTPKENIGHPSFAQSQYSVEDRSESITKSKENSNNFINAMKNYAELSKDANKSKLPAVFTYLKIPGALNISKTADETVLNSFFLDWINRSKSNITDFLRVADMVADSKKLEAKEVLIHHSLLILFEKGVIKKDGGSIFYDGLEIGTDFKNSAYNLIRNKEFLELQKNIILSLDE